MKYEYKYRDFPEWPAYVILLLLFTVVYLLDH